MKTKTPVLDSVRMAAPCTARWEEMEGDERKRYCADCRLHVFNLSDMTSAEAEEFLRNATGRICGRFYQRADGTVLTRDCPKGLAAQRARLARGLVWMAAATWMCSLAMLRGAANPGAGKLTMGELKDKVRDVQPFKMVLDVIEPKKTPVTVSSPVSSHGPYPGMIVRTVPGPSVRKKP